MNKPAFTIHLEDEQFLIVEKPVFMHTAPLQASDKDNLLAQVINIYPEIASLSGKKNIEPGLLHRLDYETSGLILIARTEKAFINLSEQFKDNQVTKCYYTISLYRAEQLAGSPLNIPLKDWSRICETWPNPSAPYAFVFQSHFKPWGPETGKSNQCRTIKKETSRGYTSRLYFGNSISKTPGRSFFTPGYPDQRLPSPGTGAPGLFRPTHRRRSTLL